MVRRRALVTGATGGLGRTLVPLLLDAGYDVVATVRDAAAGEVLAQGGALFRPADLRTADMRGLIGDAEVVFHLAARSAPWGGRADFAAINVAATARLLEAARSLGCARVIHASTPSIYAERRARIKLSETSPPAAGSPTPMPRPNTPPNGWSSPPICAAMRTVVLRPRAIVGPDDRVLLPRLMRRHPERPGRAAGRWQRAGRADRGRARCRRRVPRRRPVAEGGGPRLHISGGQPRTVAGRSWRRCAGRSISPRASWRWPTSLSLCAAWAAERAGSLSGREPALTRYAVTTLAFTQTFDLTLARTLLGWQARFGPEAAIAHALADGNASCASRACVRSRSAIAASAGHDDPRRPLAVCDLSRDGDAARPSGRGAYPVRHGL